MEWPKKKPQIKESPLVLERTFSGFTPEENAEHQKDFDDVSTPQEFIEKVDFDTLNNIFDTIIEKSGAAAKNHVTGHIVTAKSLSFRVAEEHENRTLNGQCDPISGTIILFWDDHTDVLKKYVSIRTLKTLVHEATHVRAGYKEDHYIQFEPEFKMKVIRQSGLGETYLSAVAEPERFGISLNEAVTENIALEVFQDYLTRTGNSGYLKDEELLKQIGYGSYFRDRFLLSMVIDSIANSLEVHRDEIWKGFVHAYMTNSSSLSELLDSIDEILGSDSKIAILSTLLSEDESLDAGNFTPADMTDYVSDPDLVLDAAKRIKTSFDVHAFANVLGLK